MIEFIKQWVINIVTLVLFIVIFEMLLPAGKMKKYASLVTGTILIIAIISPLVNIFSGKFDFTAIQTLNGNAFDKLQVQKDSNVFEKEQMKQIVELYRKKIIEQLEQNAEEVEGVKQAKADIIFNEDYTSNTFGEIKRAYLEITDGVSSPEIEAVKKIEHVKVGEVKKQQAAAEDCDPIMRKRLEEKISNAFGIKRENIIISQMKR